MKRKLKFLFTAAATALFSGNVAHAAVMPLMTYEVLGEDVTKNQSTFTNSLTVASGDSVSWEVLGSMAAVGTVGTKTITGLTFGSTGTTNDGITAFPSTVTQTGTIPITFTSFAMPGNGQASGFIAGTPGSNTISFKDVVSTTTGGYVAFGVVATDTPGYQVLASGMFTVGAAAPGSTSTLADSYTASGSGSFRINGGSNTFLTSTNDPTYDGYSPLTLSAPAPEPGSLSFLAVASAGLLAARRRRRTI
jgi:hypothetical protein